MARISCHKKNGEPEWGALTHGVKTSSACAIRGHPKKGLLRVRLLGVFCVDAFLYLLEPNLEYAIGFVDDEDLHEKDACDI